MKTKVVSDDRIVKIIEAVNNSGLSSVKSIVTGIVRIIHDPKSTVKDLIDIIQVDPPLTARILRVSNSVFYSPQSKIDELGKAIIWIGYDTVKEISLRQKTCEMFEKSESIEGYRRTELWAYCVATAHFAKMIYRREFREIGDNIYTAGILHKIGLIAEEQFLRKAFTKILRLCNESDCSLCAMEKDVLGFSHPELGRYIAENWLLPADLVAAIGFHDNPYAAPKEFFKECATLYVAAVQCHFAQIGYVKATPFDDELYGRCLEDLHLTQESLNVIVAEGQQEIAEMLEKGAL